MEEGKDTARALVKIGYDGTVHKYFRHRFAKERFDNELRVLQYLEERGCEFVPRVLSYDVDKLELVTTNCGARVDRMDDDKLKAIFAELETYGVRHDDPTLQNITYRSRDGRFCLIDFEFATILDSSVAAPPPIPVVTGPINADEFIVPAVPTRMKWSGYRHAGKVRPNNEDEFLGVAFNQGEFNYLAANGQSSIDGFDYVFAVSDGMGGERSGEFASKFAIDNITRLMPQRYHLKLKHQAGGIRDCIRELFLGIHRQLTVLGNSYDEGKNMGATLSLAWFVEDRFYFGHIGDSRIYLLPQGGGLKQLTHDDTHVGWLKRKGELNEREARQHPRKNVLSQALGAGNRYVVPQIGEMKLAPGDRLLLCTDGVIEGLWEHSLEDLIRFPQGKLIGEPPAKRIVEAAVAADGRDNATAMVIECG
ncbi:protein phosphatase 2C domain-containing protein [Planctomicrobium piriforme]|uniref:Serine/threonine protein phosphatase PrpC n=1 Tax=Planctomicrobium piriforme TaxID=1576369 RepID=A0A1I3NMK1_9PLAN|nr:protein phosphatase 2C domain-containing protein [Planctomicrobium piriforme]SFJ10397.1 Serine/threonine protein phosphatase PrpC [Planctomicrobium piriforme]